MRRAVRLLPANPSAVTTTETGVGHAVPQQNVGMPIRAGTGIQEQVTDVGKFAAGFHNNWLLALCVIISLVVLNLLAVTLIKFRRGANSYAIAHLAQHGA